MIIVSLLLYILLFSLVLLILVICVPINYRFAASKYATVKFQGEIAWLWGLIQLSFTKDPSSTSKVIIKPIGIPISISNDKVNNSQKKKVKSRNKRQKDPSKPKDNLMFLLKQINKEVLFSFINTIEKMWCSIKPKVLVLKAVYGFDDPYHNAIVLAIISSFYPMLKDYDIQLTPSFEGPIFEGEFEVQGKIVIILLLYIIVKLILSKPIRNIIKSIRKNKEEKAYVH